MKIKCKPFIAPASLGAIKGTAADGGFYWHLRIYHAAADIAEYDAQLAQLRAKDDGSNLIRRQISTIEKRKAAAEERAEAELLRVHAVAAYLREKIK